MAKTRVFNLGEVEVPANSNPNVVPTVALPTGKDYELRFECALMDLTDQEIALDMEPVGESFYDIVLTTNNFVRGITGTILAFQTMWVKDWPGGTIEVRPSNDPGAVFRMARMVLIATECDLR